MKWARFARGDGRIAYGLVEGEVVHEVSGSPLVVWEETDVSHDLAHLKLLAPVLPTKVVAVGRNYADHAAEHGADVPTEPMIFLKPSTAVVGTGEAIRIPADVGRVEHEGELAVVIGRVARRVAAEEAGAVILGYTCGNDVSARELQRRDGQWGRAKGFDTFCPLGPWIDTDADPLDLVIVVTVDGEVRQEATTADMVHGVGALVEFISRVMTLLPGDVILTGTPAGVGPIEPGDVVEVDIEDIGMLSNPVEWVQ